MTKKHAKKVTAVLFACLALLIMQPGAYSNIFSRHNGYRPVKIMPRGHVPILVRGHRYFYHRGLFYRNYNRGFLLVAPPAGAIVPLLPLGFMTIMLGSVIYHCYDGVYYRECPSGYIVVPESEYLERKSELEKRNEKPVEKMEVNDSEKEFVVYVPNKDGSFSPVKLQKKENGYTGPQGEFYPDRPTVKQLQVLYGK